MQNKEIFGNYLESGHDQADFQKIVHVHISMREF